MALVAALYGAHAVLVAGGGEGLRIGWLALLLVPGFVAADVAERRGMLDQAEEEAVRGGLLVGHFAVALQLCVLAIALTQIDWQRYAAQVGEGIATGVRDSAVPAALVTAALLVPLTYVGCVGGAWLGAVTYTAILRRTTGGEQKSTQG
jgi:hypothetical protein